MDESEPALSREEQQRLADEIAEIAARIDAATHRLLACIRRFDASGAWAEQGALSCAHWLTWRIGLDIGAAREHVRVARALGALPRIDRALRLGRVSYSKARAMTRVATAANEATLLAWARTSTGAQMEKICARYRGLKRHRGVVPVDEPEIRYVRRQVTASGMVRIVAQLLPEEAAVVMKALEVARERVGEVSAETSHAAAEGEAGRCAGTSDAAVETPHDGARKPGVAVRTQNEDGHGPGRCAGTSADPGESWAEIGRRDDAGRVDALLWLAEAALAGRITGAAHPPVEIVVHVDEHDLVRAREGAAGILDDGTRLERASTARLLCDAALVPVVEDAAGAPLDVGRRTRVIPAALRRALRLRDRGCRFPGCTHQRTDGHHVVPWSRGGPTALGNLLSLCRRHHRFVHELGWRVELRAGGDALFCDPRGEPVPPVPVSDEIRTDVIEALRRELADAGIDIDAQTSCPAWDGYGPDYGLAVDALLRMEPDEVRVDTRVSGERSMSIG